MLNWGFVDEQAGGGPGTHDNASGEGIQPTSWALSQAIFQLHQAEAWSHRAGGQRLLALALSTHRAPKHPCYLWQALAFLEKVL